MKVLQRYLSRQIFLSTALVLLVLLALYTFIDLMTELDELGRGNYRMGDILTYLVLTMPKRIYELLPVAALLGSVIGLGNLAGQSELVAMRAAGMSVKDINRSVLRVALVLLLFALLVGEGIRPLSEQSAREFRSLARTGTVGSRSAHGFWTRDGNHFNHIQHINPDGSFSNLVIYEFDNAHRLRVLTKAATAVYDGDIWLLSDVVQSIIDKAGVEVLSVSRKEWASRLNPGMLNVVVVPPAFLPVWDLLEYIDYLQMNYQATEQYELAFWSKLMMPLSSAVMVLLAVPFVFGQLRNVQIGGRIVAGAIVGIVFHLFNQSFQHMGLVYGLPPWLAAAFPALSFAMIAWWLNKQVE